jgi:flagellar hook-length control protein FliK
MTSVSLSMSAAKPQAVGRMPASSAQSAPDAGAAGDFASMLKQLSNGDQAQASSAGKGNAANHGKQAGSRTTASAAGGAGGAGAETKRLPWAGDVQTPSATADNAHAADGSAASDGGDEAAGDAATATPNTEDAQDASDTIAGTVSVDVPQNPPLYIPFGALWRTGNAATETRQDGEATSADTKTAAGAAAGQTDEQTAGGSAAVPGSGVRGRIIGAGTAHRQMPVGAQLTAASGRHAKSGVGSENGFTTAAAESLVDAQTASSDELSALQTAEQAFSSVHDPGRRGHGAERFNATSQQGQGTPDQFASDHGLDKAFAERSAIREYIDTAVSAAAEGAAVSKSNVEGAHENAAAPTLAHSSSAASAVAHAVAGFGAVSSLVSSSAITTSSAETVQQAGRAILDQDVSRQIVQAIRLQWQNGIGDARMTLNPDYLGEVSISLRVEQGNVTASLSADTPSVRAWIESNEPMLRQGLAEQGLTLTRLVISQERPQESQDRQDRRQPSGQQPSGQEPRRRQNRRGEQPSFELVM